MRNGSKENWLGFLLLTFLLSNKGRVLTEILFAVRQECLCPSSSSPFWSSPITISLFLVCYLANSPFPFPAFPNSLIFLELTFLRGSTRQQLTPHLFHVFCFSWGYSHLSLSSTCVQSGLVGHSHQASPIHLFRATFAPVTAPRPTKTQEQGENLGSSPHKCMRPCSWPHITVVIRVLGAGSEIRSSQETPLPPGRQVGGVAAGATRLGLNLELRLPKLFLPPQQLKFYSALFSLQEQVFTCATNIALIYSAHNFCNGIKTPVKKPKSWARSVKFSGFDPWTRHSKLDARS